MTGPSRRRGAVARAGSAADPPAELTVRQLDRAAGTLVAGSCDGGWDAVTGVLTDTGLVALAHLHDPWAMVGAVRAVGGPDGHDTGEPLAEDARTLWCSGIRRAVLDGTFAGVREGLALLPRRRWWRWAAWLDQAESDPPPRSAGGDVVTAFRAAWSTIVRTPVPASVPSAGSFACAHLQHALAGVQGRPDAHHERVIAGMLLGARWGLSAVPVTWQRAVPVRSTLPATDLIRLAVLTATQGGSDAFGWPDCDRYPADERDRLVMVAHPHDPDVVLGNLVLAGSVGLAGLGVDAVVSLCRVGAADFADCCAASDRLQVWLLDGLGANAHPHFVVDQAARAIAQLRAEGRRVLVHCAAGKSRTPAVAARYATVAFGIPPGKALAALRATLGPERFRVNPELLRVVYDLAGAPRPHHHRLARHAGGTR